MTTTMPNGLLGLTTSLVAIPSVSHHEGLMADAVEAALGLCSWLTIDRVGNNVVARTDLGGNYGNFEVEYFLFTLTGLKRIDPKPVFDAAEALLPEHTSTYFIISSFDFPKEIWDVCVQRNDTKESRKMMGCSGTIRVRFKISNAAFVVTGAILRPN